MTDTYINALDIKLEGCYQYIDLEVSFKQLDDILVFLKHMSQQGALLHKLNIKNVAMKTARMRLDSSYAPALHQIISDNEYVDILNTEFLFSTKC